MGALELFVNYLECPTPVVISPRVFLNGTVVLGRGSGGPATGGRHGVPPGPADATADAGVFRAGSTMIRRGSCSSSAK